MDKSTFLKDLNPKQQEAVTATNGPILILAGPGSGKTRVLTHRVAYLIAEGIPAPSILALTFTNKAAEEMKVRIQHLLRTSPLNGPLPFIGTFHAFAMRLLRAHATVLGYFPSFSIFDEDDTLSLLKEIMKERGINPKQFPAGVIAHTISRLKNELVMPDEYAETTGLSDLFPKTVHTVFDAYEQRLKEAHAMDFDGLLTNVMLLFQRAPALKTDYQNQFHYLNVDEYQDVNHAQYSLISDLAGLHRNIAVVGDDAQAIYGWRGADFRNILNFEKDWPDARLIVLDQNYRSTQTILSAAEQVITKNTYQKKKHLKTEKGAGEPIELMVAQDEREEAETIRERINALLKKGAALKDIAILYRTNAQSRAIEEVFLDKNMPYRIVGGIRFYQRKEVKDILAYLRILLNPADLPGLKRIINIPPRGIGKTSLLQYLMLKNTGKIPRDRGAIATFHELLATLGGKIKTLRAALFLKQLLKDIGYRAYLNDGFPNADERWENVEELVSIAIKYNDAEPPGGIEKLLEDVALLSDTDEVKTNENALTLMTIHAAKGLEFRFVFITGLEEGIFPHARSAFNPQELEEERRLCYVGLTRAKERVFLSLALRRSRFGSIEANPPSRFLSEIPEELMNSDDSPTIEV